MGTGEFNAGGLPCDGLASHPGGVEILSVASCYRNRDKLRPDGPFSSYADSFFYHASFTICKSEFFVARELYERQSSSPVL